MTIWRKACYTPTTVDTFEAELKTRLENWGCTNADNSISKSDRSNDSGTSNVSVSAASAAFQVVGSAPATAVNPGAVVSITTTSSTGSESLYSTCVNFLVTPSSEVSNSERQLVSEVTTTEKVTVTYEKSITSKPPDYDAIYKRVHKIVSPWVVKVEAWEGERQKGKKPNSTGTGFVFNDKYNLLLTFRHVVVKNERESKPYKSIAITARSDENNVEESCSAPSYIGVEVIKDSKGLGCDIAVLRVNEDDIKKFKSWHTNCGKLRKSNLASDDEMSTVYSCGCPAGLDFTASLGSISYARRVYDGVKYVQFNNINIDKGSSGGPLCDMDGYVIGMIDHMDEDKALNRFGKKMSEILENLKRAGQSLSEAGKNNYKRDVAGSGVSENIGKAGENLRQAGENVNILEKNPPKRVFFCSAFQQNY